MKYKKGTREFYSENSLNADFYRDFLREKCGFQRFEWESCGYPQRFPEGKTVCIFLFIRRILPSTVSFMQSVQRENGENSVL